MIFLVLLCATPAAAAPISCDACLSSAKGCSQKKQDVWVMRTLVPHIEEGAKFFIDLAANRPVCGSNSVLLERKYGWRGLCIDANPQFIVSLRENRKCMVRSAAVANESGVIMAFSGNGETGGLVRTGFDHETAGRGPSFKVTTQRLDTLLRETSAPRVIGYLSLDVEGAEEAALPENFPFGTFTFLAVTIERPPPKLSERLFRHGYLWVKNSYYDAFFVHARHPRAANLQRNASFLHVPAKCTPARRQIVRRSGHCAGYGCCEFPGRPQETTSYDAMADAIRDDESLLPRKTQRTQSA